MNWTEWTKDFYCADPNAAHAYNEHQADPAIPNVLVIFCALGQQKLDRTQYDGDESCIGV